MTNKEKETYIRLVGWERNTVDTNQWEIPGMVMIFDNDHKFSGQFAFTLSQAYRIELKHLYLRKEKKTVFNSILWASTQMISPMAITGIQPMMKPSGMIYTLAENFIFSTDSEN